MNSEPVSKTVAENLLKIGERLRIQGDYGPDWSGVADATTCDLGAIELDRMSEALDKINMLACYASEENTDAQRAALLEIGKLARGEASGDPWNDD